jgi:hypothetical protein
MKMKGKSEVLGEKPATFSTTNLTQTDPNWYRSMNFMSAVFKNAVRTSLRAQFVRIVNTNV